MTTYDDYGDSYNDVNSYVDIDDYNHNDDYGDHWWRLRLRFNLTTRDTRGQRKSTTFILTMVTLPNKSDGHFKSEISANLQNTYDLGSYG